MNYKLAQFFLACKNSNFICWIHWNAIYQREDVTEEDKKVWLHWSNTVDVKKGMESFVFFKKDSNENPMPEWIGRIPMDILVKIKQDEHVDSDIRRSAQAEIDNRENIKRDYETYMIRCKQSNEAISGWLSPQGKFYDVEWGEHERFACDYTEEHKLEKERREFRLEGGGIYGKTFLIHKKRFILIDNPERDGAVTISYRTMTNAQKRFLYDYLIKINDSDALKEMETV